MKWSPVRSSLKPPPVNSSRRNFEQVAAQVQIMGKLVETMAARRLAVASGSNWSP